MLKKCDGRMDGQTDLCIELRYAQLIKTMQSIQYVVPFNLKA